MFLVGYIVTTFAACITMFD